MKRRILFVDDQPEILSGLRKVLRRHRRVWDMVFANSGEEALSQLAQAPFDVVVTDMRMPGLDGAALLSRVQGEHPEVVRIILSGGSELEATMRAIPVAHQYLAKPCNSEILENVIERACNLQTLITDESIRRMVGKIEKLPSLPTMYSQLTQVIADPNATAAQIAGILEQDMAMCAKILQIVNSAFFRVARQITSIEEAVIYLGFNMIKNLALSAKIFANDRQYPNIPGFNIGELQRHALLVASIASKISPSKQQREDTFAAGLLHDIGLLVFALELPEQLSAAIAHATEHTCPLYQAEQKILGIPHDAIGGYLLGIWGLPYPVIEAVMHHHDPSVIDQQEFDVLGAVHVADALAGEVAPLSLEVKTAPEIRLDEQYLTRLGVSEKLQPWRNLVADYVANYSL